MICKFLEDHRSVSDDGFQSHGIYSSPIARIPSCIPNAVFLILCLVLRPLLHCSRSVPQHGPVGRSWHSFTPVSSDHIFLFGGFTTERETLSESNILFHQGKKRKREKDSKPSWVHSACPVSFQVMLGCTVWAKMNGSLSNTTTRRDQG